MAGATAMTIVIVPIIWPRRSSGTRLITVVISSGTISAVPEACTMRATSSTSKPGASAAISVPVLNADIAAMNSVRVWKLCCSRKPEIGITVAIVSRNAVVSHRAVVAGMPRSRMRCGSATPMIVSLRITTNAAPMRSWIKRR